ncbi:hypothetical protein MMC22_003761 [Lobaria immixta]|nr:hypothetical protein [Lobaria immixta]
MARAGFYKSQDGVDVIGFLLTKSFFSEGSEISSAVTENFAHRNCFGDRKIVLDVHQQPDLRLEPAEELFPNFLSYFRSECKSASKSNGLVLLCVFCHGQHMEYGLEIGGKDEDGPLLTVAAISGILTGHKYKWMGYYAGIERRKQQV